MGSNVLKNFDDLFKDFNNVSVNNIESLVHESLKVFEYLRDKLQSPDQEEREKAIALAAELQKKLEEQAEKALAATGMNRSELDEFLSSSANFAPEEWNALENTQKELSSYQADVLKEASPRGPDLKTRKPRRININKIQG